MSTTQTIKLLKVGDNWELHGITYDTKDIPKSAKFRWNPETKLWWTNTPIFAASLICFAEGEVEQELIEVKKRIENSYAKSSNIEFPIPTGLTYMPFQKAGIEFAINNQNTLIGDEMGLGKTIQVIGVINTKPEIRKVLIICPNSLKLNWRKELNKWLVRPMTIGLVNGSFPETEIVIMNYDIAKKWREKINTIDWDLFVADEAHLMKNYKTQRTASILGTDKGGFVKAKQNIFLTGTPIANKPIELFTLVNFLDKKNFGSWTYYAKRYCDMHHNGYAMDVSGASNLDELQSKLRSSVMIRRMKVDVLTELPNKVRQIIPIEPSNAAQRIIDRQNEITDKFLSDKNLSYEDVVGNLTIGGASFEEISRMRRELGELKADQVIAYLEDELENGKVVCFAHHKVVIEKIKEKFGDLCVVITGETPIEQRQQAVEAFQTNPDIKLFIGSILACATGLTLTASSNVVFAELDWVPANLQQAEDRCHRIGQEYSVTVKHLVYDGSLDARMCEILVNKMAVIAKAIDSKIEDVKERTDAFNDKIQETLQTVQEQIEIREEKKRVERINTVTLSDVDIALIHNEIRLLVKRCDGAQTLDGNGFNKLDTSFGHDLANKVLLSNKQALAGFKMIIKYKRQFSSEMLIEYDRLLNLTRKERQPLT